MATRRPFYAPTYNYRGGVQSAYDAGLSYFPDVGSGSYVATPLGLTPSDLGTDLGAGVGLAAGGPGGAAVGSQIGSLLGSIFGGGSAVDAARLARVQYFVNLAAQGNVAAMQLILGAPPNVSGNEQQMWVTAAQQIQQQAPGVYQAALVAGPHWLVNSGDTATNYPAMRNYVQTWAAQNPVSAAAGAASSFIGGLFTPTPVPHPAYPGGPMVTTPTAGIPPVVLYGALAAGAYFLISRRRRA